MNSRAGFSIHQNATHKSNSEPLSGPCEGYCNSDARGSGPHTEAEYAERVAASRRLGLVLSLVIVAIFSIVQWVAS